MKLLSLIFSSGIARILSMAGSLAPSIVIAAGPAVGGSFPDFTLTTQEGVKVRFYEDLVKGKSVAINVIYTSCKDECPLETARLAEVQSLLGNRVGKDVSFISISIDPEVDRPQVLKRYAQKFGVGPGWYFLTGDKKDINVLTRKLGLARNTDAISKDGHASSLMLGNDATGQWMRNSAVDNPRFLAATMSNFFGWKDDLNTASYANARPSDMGRAQFTFESRCASCHTIGKGDRIGPDLAHVNHRRDLAWLMRYLKEPDKVLASGDPIAVGLFSKYNGVRMPNLRLGDEDVDVLLRYIVEQSEVSSSGSAGSAGHTHHKH
ncbi:SCO family protein [Variovorax sp. RHLX14]|uniref:SCO family protein n=1 Tax=Variovorax sp. RHLX14 TaxID=1259731 RepID=UPI003F449EEA